MYYNLEDARQASEAINKNGGTAKSIKVDISNRKEVEEMIEIPAKEFGALDTLVNNARIMDDLQPAEEITDELWDRVFAVNMNSVMYATRKTPDFMYSQKGIRINAIAPRATMTNIGNTLKNVSEFGQQRTGLTQALIPRVESSEEIAAVAFFLATDASSFVNGQVITADGGWKAGS